jgi:hypothetical protein
VPQALRGGGQMRERAGQGSGQPEREQHPCRQRSEADRSEADGDVADVVVDLLHAPSDPNGTQEPLLVLDRNGGRHDVVAQIDAVPDLGERRPLERAPDLRSTRRGVPRLRGHGSVRVRDEEPLFVHHEYPSTHLGCRLRDDPVEASRVVDVVQTDLRGDPLCLEQGPSRDLGRRAPLEVDGERDPERDDQDDQDVREREDEPGSYLRGAS